MQGTGTKLDAADHPLDLARTIAGTLDHCPYIVRHDCKAVTGISATFSAWRLVCLAIGRCPRGPAEVAGLFDQLAGATTARMTFSVCSRGVAQLLLAVAGRIGGLARLGSGNVALPTTPSTVWLIDHRGSDHLDSLVCC